MDYKSSTDLQIAIKRINYICNYINKYNNDIFAKKRNLNLILELSELQAFLKKSIKYHKRELYGI